MAAHPWRLDDAEFDAILALQRGERARPRDDPVWLSLVEKRLVELAGGREPRELKLTPLGMRYPEPA
jgi:hypothetical protein